MNVPTTIDELSNVTSTIVDKSLSTGGCVAGRRVEGWDGSFTRPYYRTIMLEVLDIAILGSLMLFSVLFGLLVAYKVAKPRLLSTIRGAGLAIGNQISKSMADVVENVDVGEIIGKIGGGEGGENPLAALAGGGGGGIGDLLKLLAQFSGKNKGGGGSSGW